MGGEHVSGRVAKDVFKNVQMLSRLTSRRLVSACSVLSDHNTIPCPGLDFCRGELFSVNNSMEFATYLLLECGLWTLSERELWIGRQIWILAGFGPKVSAPDRCWNENHNKTRAAWRLTFGRRRWPAADTLVPSSSWPSVASWTAATTWYLRAKVCVLFCVMLLFGEPRLMKVCHAIRQMASRCFDRATPATGLAHSRATRAPSGASPSTQTPPGLRPALQTSQLRSAKFYAFQASK